MLHQQPYAERRRSIPAWVMSLVMHLVLLVAMSFLLVAPDRTVSDSEALRPVGIVLAQRTRETERQYFTDPAEVEESSEPESTADTNDSPNVPEAAAVAPDSLVASEFGLPTSTDIPLAGVATVDTPSLTVSGRRPKLPGVDESEIIAEAQARMIASKQRGPTAQLGLFGSRKATGNSFVFLIDRSKSMGGSGLGVLHEAADELVRALRPLQPEHRFQVVVYHERSIYMNGRDLLPATEENKTAVSEFLSGIASFGATEHRRALMSVLRLEPDVIFLLTDGGDPVLKDHEIRSLAEIAGSSTTIHCLHFGSGPPGDSNNFLQRLAAQTGGDYGYIDVRQRRE